MKVLVACEFSGAVRDAFLARGHDAISCDLLPTEAPGPHIEGDVRRLDLSGYDLVIAHPPCQYLSWVGAPHWNDPGREAGRLAAMEFFLWCYHLQVPRVCVENPRGYPCRVFRQPDQVIDPTYFGDAFHKRTCLWLRGLPPLVYTGPVVTAGAPTMMEWRRASGKKWKLEAHLTSKTAPGIAAAMADQWGGYE